MSHLRLPATPIAREFVTEHDRNTIARLLVVKFDSVA